MIHFNNKTHLISLMESLLPAIINDVKYRLETKTQAQVAKETHVSRDTISRLAIYGGVDVSINTMLRYIDKSGGSIDIDLVLSGQKTKVKLPK